MTRSKNRLTPTRPDPRPPLNSQQETLVTDERAGLTPSQVVEQRLVSMLRSNILPASQLQASRMRRTLS